jgi:hypothetical protein
MAGGYGNIKPEDGIQFSSTNQPENRGRKPKSFKMFNDLMKEKGYELLSKEQLIECYSLIFSADEEMISEIANDASQPLALRLIISELTDNHTRSKALADYRDYMFGKAKDIKEVSIVEQPLFPE